MKKLVSMVCSLAVFMTLFAGLSLPITVSAETSGDFKYIILEDGTAELADYTGSGGDVVIPETLGGYKVTRMYCTFWGCDSLTSITIPDTVTDIQYGTFYQCTNLVNVTIPASVTYIGYYAFAYCSSIENLYYTGTADDWVAITIDDYAESPMGTADNVYFGGELVTDVVLSDGIMEIKSNAFSGCNSLTSITIPASVTSIGKSAFSGCNSLTSITIPDSVTFIDDYTFAFCSGLASITIPDSVTNIGKRAFSYCSGLIGITIPDSVTFIDDYAFAYCSGLASITIPDSVTDIGECAFYDTAYYNDVANWENDVLYIGNHLIQAKETIQGDYVVKNGTKIIACSAFAYCEGLAGITIPESVTEIDRYVFYNCTGLASVMIPDSVTTIDSYAFAYCEALTSITIPDSVTVITNNVFVKCTSLASITISDHVTFIGGYAFSYCDSLVDITLPESGEIVLGNRVFYQSAYYNDTANWENDVLYIGNHLIEAKDTVEGDYVIKDGTKTIAWFAFSDCDSLASVTIPDSVTGIGNTVFNGCKNVTLLVYEESYAHQYAQDNAIPYRLISDVAPGDLDADGEINAADVASLFYAVNGVDELMAEQLAMADVTGDGKVGLADAVRLFYIASGLI